MQFHLLSFEGPDAYSRAGGLATRVVGLAETLAAQGHETHLWFIGAPDLPGYEAQGNLHYHRWCQWVSQYHPDGVYDGEIGKMAEYNASLPPHLSREVLFPHLRAGGRSVILAEEWQMVDAVLHLHWLLKQAGLRDRVNLLWNANNVFGFERIPWRQLAAAAAITTVSRYMKHRLWEFGVDAMVIPNGLPGDAFDAPARGQVQKLRGRFRDRTLLTKMARWDPDKRWVATMDLLAELKRRGWRPLLVARGGKEAHGGEVWAAAYAKGLRVIDRTARREGGVGLIDALRQLNDADVVNLHSFVDPEGRRVLFRGSAAVLANSSHEPFGLVGLEAMAAGGLACTGCSGEDYAAAGRNALVLETDDPNEFIAMFDRLRTHPAEARALRRAGQATARRYVWSEIVDRILMPRIQLPDADADCYEETPRAPSVRGKAASAARSVG